MGAKQGKSKQGQMSETADGGDLASELDNARAERERLLAKEQKARAKSTRRRARLSELEAHITLLEHQAGEPAQGGTPAVEAGPALPSTSVRKACLIFNPTSSEDQASPKKQLKQIIHSLKEHGIEAEVDLKRSRDQAQTLARDAVKNGHALVIVAGGDDTIEEIVPYLVGAHTALGIIPMGAMNNLAKALGIPEDIDQACSLIGTGSPSSLDAGRISSPENPRGHFFLEAAGAGLSAIAALPRWEKLPETFRRYDLPARRFVVEIDGQMIESNPKIVTVSNSPLFDRNALVAPDARMDDGWLDVAIYDGMKKKAILEYFKTTRRSKRVDNPQVQFHRGRTVRLTAEAASVDRPKIKAKAKKNRGDKDNSVESSPVVPPFLQIEVIPGALSAHVGQGIAASTMQAAEPGSRALTVAAPVPVDLDNVPPRDEPRPLSSDQPAEGRPDSGTALPSTAPATLHESSDQPAEGRPDVGTPSSSRELSPVAATHDEPVLDSLAPAPSDIETDLDAPSPIEDLESPTDWAYSTPPSPQSLTGWLSSEPSSEESSTSEAENLPRTAENF